MAMAFLEGVHDGGTWIYPVSHGYHVGMCGMWTLSALRNPKELVMEIGDGRLSCGKRSVTAG